MFRYSVLILAAFLLAGCIAVPTRDVPPPVAYDEVVALSRQGVPEDVLIGMFEQRGVAFMLEAGDAERLRSSGVGEGVVAYLQGRATGARETRAQLDRYYADYYYPAFLFHPFLALHWGFHRHGWHGGGFYGGPFWHRGPRYRYRSRR